MSTPTTAPLTMDYQELSALASGSPMTPVTYQYRDADFDPLTALTILQADDARAMLLTENESDSADDYTFIAADIDATVTLRNGQLTQTTAAGTTTTTTALAPTIDAILAKMRTPHISGLPPFLGGVSGYFAYEYVQATHHGLTLTAADPYALNDADLFVVTGSVAFNRATQTVTLSTLIPSVTLTPATYAAAIAKLQQRRALLNTGTAGAPAAPTLTTPLTPAFTPAEFTVKVAQAKAHITAGDIFQLILSNQQHAHISGQLLGAARTLFAANPTPYQFYFRHGNYAALGASPEKLITQRGAKLSTYPLAGTRRRGRTPAEDAAFATELQTSPKEQAEHNMLIDLGRNDLGAISEFGTVRVTTTRALLKFANVMHLGSVVESTIAPGITPMQVIASALPAGTLAGAPKQSAMTIIDALEPTKRGLYGGAIGYFSADGNLNFAIGIRLCYRKGADLVIQSGAGIVADSDPALEYKEFTNKISSIKAALLAASGRTNA